MGFIQTLVSFVYSFWSLFYFSESRNSQSIKEEPINYEIISNEVTRLLVEEVEAELGYKCEMSGGSMPRDIESIAVGFAIEERASIDRARELEVEITERFLRIINAHEKIRPFLREYPFSAGRARIQLKFYDTNRNRSQSGDCVCLVLEAHGELIYYSNFSEEGYELTDIAREKYEDALGIVKRNRPTSF